MATGLAGASSRGSLDVDWGSLLCISGSLFRIVSGTALNQRLSDAHIVKSVNVLLTVSRLRLAA
ncbi:hypothetical protein [Methylobacterium platani]|uniref:Uncharacterized protein n=2 Tax=Methylobacterium platani TaxID=427683 RepID=A0A179SGH4_9HYPH|nr:hypothetical protein [Methylobacterium platani]KMO10226.1 hypothetical protein SQ03_30890 [Methylobacterium platani JCM 14648]OAS25566.1 hypothetical protein A5481_09460 [Methylobacterium platani]